CAALLVATAGVVAPRAARAANPPACPLSLSSKGEVSPPGGNTFEVCGGRVRSFDGTPLQLDVSLPEVPYYPPGSSTPATPPLMLFMSGWSNDYCQFESTTLEGSAVSGCGDFIGNPGWHWNNAWFASQGWVTITYTPRGWYDSCGNDLANSYENATDSTCSDTTGEESWVHLYDRRWEIRDAQYLAGLLVDAGLVNPQQIVASGDSGGGGPSWDMALTQDQVVRLDSTPASVDTQPWTSPVNHTPMHLAAALPMFTWTDLIDSLMPNGTASDGFNGAPADGDHQSPVGFEKESYVTGLFAKGVSNVPSYPYQTAQYSKPCPALGCDATADLTTWFADINAGEPSFAVNPDTPTILAQVGGQLRSPLAIPVPPPGKQIPIFSIQGLTDPLFPADQTLMMLNRLKSAYANYPVWAFFGDLGHSYADNPLDVWQQAHAEANTWLSQVLQGLTPSASPVTVDTTRCVTGQTLSSFSAASLGSVATQQLTFSDTTSSQMSTSAVAASYEGTQTDPIANIGCRSITASQLSSNASSIPAQAVYSFPITSDVTLVGGPTVRVDAAVSGGPSGEVDARLWDVDAAGNQTLISRGAYRIDDGMSTTTSLSLDFELWPNAWQLQTGHSVKLELTQDDGPVFRPDNEQSSITFTDLTLILPVVQGVGSPPPSGVPEVPLTPLLPVVAFAAVGGVALLARRRIRT
ncbi:MAG: hypothetical protein JOZ92_05535, partial [Candidatus Dormibacteraeota bacterium]|nr:hypothetical protein [Candidatus Dormibacteraeota bacterium]